MKSSCILIGVFFLLILPFGIIIAGAEIQSDSAQTATTKDGKTVILNSDGTWKYAESSAAPAQSTLSIEAALIYRSGDVKPVARTEFKLLDKSLSSILREAGLQPDSRISSLMGGSSDDKLLNTYSWAVTMSGLDDFATRASEAIKSHVIQTVVTDFTGKAAFSPVKPGTYYIVGTIRPPNSHVTWNVETDLKPGESKVILDPNNATAGP